MQAGIGVASALVPPSGWGSDLSPSDLRSQTPTTITRTHTAPTVTTPPPRHTIRRHRIIRPRGAVGTPITDTTTLAEGRAAHLRQIGLVPQVKAPPKPRSSQRGRSKALAGVLGVAAEDIQVRDRLLGRPLGGSVLPRGGVWLSPTNGSSGR